MKHTMENFRPWLWLAREMMWPAMVFAFPLVMWATTKPMVNVMDATGGALLASALWMAHDKLRDLRDILTSILAHTKGPLNPRGKEGLTDE